MQKILIVEDDEDIQELLKNFLENEGYELKIAGDGVEAIEIFNNNSFDLLLVDILLPKINGYCVCELIRKASNIPIIMLTALESEENQIEGFNLKIDDYITKPFSMKILIHKIKAILRRISKSIDEDFDCIKYKNIVLNCDGYTVWTGKDKVNLTKREFELLKELLLNRGKVLTRQLLLDSIWTYDYFGDERTVDTHIKNIRKKLNIDFIETVHGVGYKIDK